MQSLIEQVRKAANRMPIIKTVEPRPLGRRQDGIQFARPEEYDELDLRVVLAHLERMQAVVDAARKLDLDREDNNDGRAVGHWDASAEDALNAALEKESNAKR